jgi:hypothetical protein
VLLQQEGDFRLELPERTVKQIADLGCRSVPLPLLGQFLTGGELLQSEQRTGGKHQLTGDMLTRGEGSGDLLGGFPAVAIEGRHGSVTFLDPRSNLRTGKFGPVPKSTRAI